jgi:UDP-N-acetyl-D-mannosaminuronic acid dehydrogenase
VNILHPGPGVGGHCIAVDPWFIVNAAPERSTLIRTAREINDAQPDYVVDLVERAVDGIDRPVIAVLGLAYKANVDDVRESPAVHVAQGLASRGYDLRLHDAHAKALPDGTAIERDLTTAVDGADAIVILTDHREYRELLPDDQALAGLRHRILVDTRYCIDSDAWRQAGYDVHQLGVGGTGVRVAETVA